MELLKQVQQWEEFRVIDYIGIENGEIVYKYYLEDMDNGDGYFLGGVYVTEKYRRQGYFYEIMNQVFDLECNIHLKCYKGSTIIDKYLEMGFEIEDLEDEKYQWYFKENKI